MLDKKKNREIETNIKKERLDWKSFWKKKIDIKKYSFAELLNLHGYGRGAAGATSIRHYKSYKIRIKKILKPFSKESILDYGGATGLFINYFTNNHLCYSYDQSNYLTKIGIKNFKKVIFFKKKSDIKNYKFDHVICNSVFHYLTYKEVKNLLNFFYKVANKSILITELPNIDLKIKNLRLRKKLFTKKTNYILPEHTFFSELFFRKFAKKKNLTIKFYNNILKNKQGKFRFSLLLKKK